MDFEDKQPKQIRPSSKQTKAKVWIIKPWIYAMEDKIAILALQSNEEWFESV